MAVLAEGIHIRGSSLVLQAAPLHGAEGHVQAVGDVRGWRRDADSGMGDLDHRGGSQVGVLDVLYRAAPGKGNPRVGCDPLLPFVNDHVRSEPSLSGIGLWNLSVVCSSST